MDNKDFDMVLEDKDGNKLNCNIVAKWQDGNNYIAYTDGTKTGNDLNLFVSKYAMKDNAIHLDPIDDDDEWNKVNTFLDKYLYEQE